MPQFDPRGELALVIIDYAVPVPGSGVPLARDFSQATSLQYGGVFAGNIGNPGWVPKAPRPGRFAGTLIIAPISGNLAHPHQVGAEVVPSQLIVMPAGRHVALRCLGPSVYVVIETKSGPESLRLPTGSFITGSVAHDRPQLDTRSNNRKSELLPPGLVGGISFASHQLLHSMASARTVVSEDYILLVCLEGTLSVTCGVDGVRATRVISAGGRIIIPPGIRHRLAGQSSFGCSLLQFNLTQPTR